MDQAEAQRRDRVLRAFFEGKDWDQNDEFMLKRAMVLNSREWLPAHPFVIDERHSRWPTTKG